MAKNMRNIRKAREYVEDVMRRLRESSQLVEAVEPSELYTTDDGDWKLQDGAIHGLARVGHDHKPYLLPAPPRGEERDEEGDAKAPPARFDVALTVLVPDCEFDAWYEYEGAAQPMSGSLTGKVDMVRVDLVIGHPEKPGGGAELKVFDAKEFTGLEVSKLKVGLMQQKCISHAAAQAVRSCVALAMALRVAPILAGLLKEVPYPEFALV
ncbi:uncharacterized protein LOC144175304 [Haemaphysalis longicornis]